MAHKTQNTQTDIMVETKGKLELFFDKYGNKILWTLAIVAIAFGAYFIYKSYADGKEREKAQKADVALANALVEEMIFALGYALMKFMILAEWSGSIC